MGVGRQPRRRRANGSASREAREARRLSSRASSAAHLLRASATDPPARLGLERRLRVHVSNRALDVPVNRLSFWYMSSGITYYLDEVDVVAGHTISLNPAFTYQTVMDSG